MAMRYSHARKSVSPANVSSERHARRYVFLHRVLGLVERGEHPVAVHVQLAPVALGDAGERGFVSRCVCHARYNVGPRADSIGRPTTFS